ARRGGTEDGGTWAALAKPARRLKPGARLACERDPAATAVVIGRGGDDGVLLVRIFPGREPEAFFEECGEVPLPPYVSEPLGDPDRYQTVYAAVTGSTAAPTAGMHFTAALMERIKERGCGFARVTLHVGPATFRPIRSAAVEDHPMHTEWYSVPLETARALVGARREGRRIAAVGTTVVRALETWAAALDPDGGAALGALEPRPARGWTNLYITGGFRFRAVDALLTNFHLPRSTLLVLVSSFCGRETLLNAYQEAIRAEYRFYSFGDAMLIL
ncbi:MAG: S-adenosylmethionine:tRNA ribosyltransferase-isomerase, partial [bacterium]